MTGELARGVKLREMRELCAPRQSVEDLAEATGVNYKTIRDRWEHGKNAEFEPFWAYLKALKKSAIRADKLAEFEVALDGVVQQFFPEVYEEFMKAHGKGDTRTREEWAQDLVDLSRDQEIGKQLQMAQVDVIVAGLHDPGSAGPREVLPVAEIQEESSWRRLPDKAFEVSLVFPIAPDTISIHRRSHAMYRAPYLLSVDLRGQKYGIYNERGKKRVRRAFVDTKRHHLLSKASADIQNFLMQLSDEKRDVSWRTLMEGNQVPLRWSSGGILPIARCLRRGPGDSRLHDGDWAVFFLRDIPPVGLNVGNGASEIANEPLEELIGREFAEELILLNRRPARDTAVQQLIFYDQNGGRALNAGNLFKQFLQQHQQLRSQQDKVAIQPATDRRFLTPLPTPFSVRVMEDVKDGLSGDQAPDSATRCHNVIFSINPDELGIEIIRPYRFELHEDEWLMDGEILPSSRAKHAFLVRRPVVLIRVDFLREQFNKGGHLGESVDDSRFLGGRRLAEIPRDAYRIFADLDLRKARLRDIEHVLRSSRDDGERTALQQERGLIAAWLKEYERVIGEAQSGGGPLKAPSVTTLCPVSFKTLEIAFAHRIPGF